MPVSAFHSLNIPLCLRPLKGKGMDMTRVPWKGVVLLPGCLCSTRSEREGRRALFPWSRKERFAEGFSLPLLFHFFFF